MIYIILAIIYVLLYLVMVNAFSAVDPKAVPALKWMDDIEDRVIDKWYYSSNYHLIS